MEPSGTYKEQLPCGGELSVSHGRWFIEYYFRGPDLRYSGEFVRIESNEVLGIIDAYEKNWADFERLRGEVPSGGTFEMDGMKGMKVRVGGNWPGVSIRSYHMPLSKRDQIDNVIRSYRYTMERAPNVQRFLANI